MSKRKRELTVDERKLWRRVAAGVKTRRQIAEESEQSEEAHRPARRAPVTKVAPASAGPRPKSPATPQNRSNEKRVRRGKLEVGAVLDLHGHTQDSARAALLRFLAAAQRRGDRAAVVITGVGRAGEGVLKRRLPEWLREPELARLVSGYAPAHRMHGGAGAFYVFIRRAV